MPNIDSLIHALQETTIAAVVARPHDDARMSYHANGTTVRDWRAFEDVIGDYYIYHFARCVGRGARLSRTEALGRAKQLLDQQYRRQNSDHRGAYSDCRYGTNGGLRGVLDAIADGLKAESVKWYLRDQWDSRVTPCDFEAKVHIIREFFRNCGRYLDRSIQQDRPERYANDYESLITSYVEGLQRAGAMFRRL